MYRRNHVYTLLIFAILGALFALLTKKGFERIFEASFYACIASFIGLVWALMIGDSYPTTTYATQELSPLRTDTAISVFVDVGDPSLGYRVRVLNDDGSTTLQSLSAKNTTVVEDRLVNTASVTTKRHNANTTFGIGSKHGKVIRRVLTVPTGSIDYNDATPQSTR